jgi:hypothetical protein
MARHFWSVFTHRRSGVRLAVACTLGLACISATGATTGAPDEAGSTVVVSPRSFTVRPGGVHLGFSDEAIARFKTRVAANRDVAAWWQKCREEADRLAVRTSKEIMRQEWRLPEGIEPLILAYRMTGEARYGRKLHEILRTLASQPIWMKDEGLAKRDPVWNSDLAMGTTGEMFGLAYDAIRAGLTPAERKELTSAYMHRLVDPVFNDWIDGRERIHTLDTMGHNWWAHIVFGAGSGLVAVARDEPGAMAYLDRLDRAAREWWGYGGSRIETKLATFDRDGGYIESINYTELALGTYLGFRLAWQEMFKEAPANVPLLEKAVDFLIQNAYPATPAPMMVNFGDGNIHKSVSRTIANMWLAGTRRPDYLWYINEYATAVDRDIRNTPRYMVGIPARSEPEGQGSPPRLPTSAWYRGVGWATMRTSWDDNATMLAVRSGFTWNHNHADAGSFILFHKGKQLLIDSGNASYSRPEYDDYYRQSMAHNIVTFNGKAEPKEDTYLGSPSPGAIPNMMDAASIRYVFADATGPTSANFARNFRHFLWLDGVILVYDDLKAREPGQFAFQLHTEGDVKRQGQNLVVTNGDASVQVRPLFPTPFPDGGLPTDYPENMRLEERQGHPDHAPDVRTTYYAFLPADKVERQKFLTAIIPQGEGLAPQIERLTGPDMIGVRLRRDGRVTDVYFNQKADGSIRHRNATTNLMGWDTDAYILLITYKAGAEPAPSTIERLFIADGSYLRHKGTLMVDSLSKRFLIADYGKAPRFWVQGQADAELGLWLPAGASGLEVNGQRLRDGGGSGFVRLRIGH